MYFKITGIKRQVLISACLYLGQIVAGHAICWPGPIFLKFRNLSQSPLPYVPSETKMSLIASVAFIGGIPGPYIMGWLSNVQGRRPCIIIGGVISCLANIILLWANNLAMMYCGRLLSGLGIGVITVMNLVYIGEIASSSIRGILLTGLGIFTTCGSMLLYSVGFFSYFIVTAVGLALSLAFTFCAIFIPESPIFYVLKDNEDEVKEKLKYLGREEDINKILITKQEYMNTSSKKDWIELITIRSNKKALFIALVLNILQNFSGVFVIIAFSGSIFKMAGSSVNSNISMVIIGLFQLLGSVIAPVFVERNGRKILLLLSSIICFLSMLLLGVYFYLDHIQYSEINIVKWLPLLLLIIYFIGYNVGLGIIPNVLVGEIFTINVRSKGSAVAVTCTWIVGFLIMTAFGAIIENFGIHIAFWIFSCACLVACFFTIFFVPETKGKSLLEVQEILSKK